MIRHYLKIAYRNLRKHSTQSLIGIFGLAFGLACFVPAFYWLHYETTYDSFYPDAKHIYRIYAIEKQSGKVNEQVPGILERKLHEHFPATETSAGFIINYENYSAEETPYIRLRTLYADSAFFHLFPQVFIDGDAQQPLQTERHIVLTESVAIRLFGDAEKAIGQSIKSTLYSGFQPYTVSAVVKNPPHNTNLSFDIIHFPEIQHIFTANMPEESQWTYFNKQMYVKLNAFMDTETLAEQIREFTSQIAVNPNIELRMLPIADVRHQLNTELPFTLGFIRLFVAAGLLLLFSAFFNFLNLYLGLFRQRIRELRQRMVVGATGRQVILQMMFELASVTVLALALALCLVVTARPALSGLPDLSVEMPRLFYQFVVCSVLVIVLMCIAAIFPLWRLIRLSKLHVMNYKKQASMLQRMAVVVQLAVSVIFIVASLVVMMQLRFVNHKDLGFDRRGVIQITRMWQVTDHNKWTALMHELEAMPQIVNITVSDFELQHDTHTLDTEVEWTGKSIHEQPAFESINADSRFAETFRLNMKQGAWWNESDQNKVVLNEEAVRVMGLHDPIGAVVRMGTGWVVSDGTKPMKEYEVVGVARDFHTLSLRSSIYSLIIKEGSPDLMRYIRVIPGQEREVIKRITASLADIDIPVSDIQLTPLDELYDRLNHAEQIGFRLFSVLATVCLLISLFGIYAVVVASTQRRRKEIAIRKVFGAEVRDIVRIFFREHTLQVIMAGVVAIPLSYYTMHRWLQGYAYRTNIPWWLLAGVVFGIIIVVLLTVFGQVLKAANRNPAEVVKLER